MLKRRVKQYICLKIIRSTVAHETHDIFIADKAEKYDQNMSETHEKPTRSLGHHTEKLNVWLVAK